MILTFKSIYKVFKNRLFWFFVIGCGIICSCKNHDPLIDINESDIDKRFDKIWNSYLESSKGGWKNNENGRLSWDDGYALDGILAFYEKTKNLKYLDTFVVVANKIIKVNDFNTGIIDKHRGNLALTGWGSKRYTLDNSHHIFGVTDAMILSPIVNFCNIVKSDERLHQKYGNIKNIFLKIALQEYKEIQEADWIDVNSSSGYFQDPYSSSIKINTPLNQFCRVGILTIELYKATGDQKFLLYAQKLANYLKALLIYKEDYFYWKYWKTTSFEQIDLTDDLSHAMLVVQFIVLSYENNIVFKREDISSLVNLFLRNIVSSDRESFNLYIDGEGGIVTDVNISYYFLLAPYSQDILSILTNWYEKQKFILDSNSFLNHFGERIILTEGLLILYNKK